MKDTLESVRTVAIVPTYNNALTVSGVIAGIKKHVRDIIVVNDGSTDGTAEILRSEEGISLIEFPSNRGKGVALKEAFKLAVEKGFTHAITVDADGQHISDDIPLFLQAIEREPGTLWIGDRITPVEGGLPQPAKSRFGRRFGAFWYKFYTGIHIRDTQSGFRAYPLKEISSINCRGERYEYEIEILICAAWRHIPVKSFPVHILYQEERVSHFRPVRDFMRISKINSRAAISRIFFPRKYLESGGLEIREKILSLIVNELRSNATPPRAAFSLAFGVFIGITPTHGFQVLILLALTIVLRLNKPLAMLGVSISSPPLLPFWIAAGIWTGKVILPQKLLFPVLSLTRLPQDSTLLIGFIHFVIGSFVLAAVCGIATFFISLPVFRSMRGRRKLLLRSPFVKAVESVPEK
jgi:glycosyltransferase involved in cell wall biosynthesis